MSLANNRAEQHNCLCCGRIRRVCVGRRTANPRPEDVFECGYYEGHSGKPLIGTHVNIENRNLNGQTYTYGETAGAMGWFLPDLSPGQSASVTVAFMFGTKGPPSLFLHKEITDANDSYLPGDEITYTITYGPNSCDHNNVVLTDFNIFSSHDRKAFNGLCLVIVRGKPGQPGTIKLKAESDSLETATITLQSVTEKVNTGVAQRSDSEEMPKAKLVYDFKTKPGGKYIIWEVI